MKNEYLNPEYSMCALIRNENLTEQERDLYMWRRLHAREQNEEQKDKLRALAAIAATGEVVLISHNPTAHYRENAARIITQRQ